MDVNSAITAVEKYLREFIAYLLAFFWPGAQNEAGNSDAENTNKSIIFAIISAAIGAYLWNRYVLLVEGKPSDMGGVMIDSLLRWISLGMLLYLIIRLFRLTAPVVATVVTVVKVFSVAHVIAIYLAYISMNVIWMFSTQDCYTELSVSYSATIAYLFELGMLWFYLPREIITVLPKPLNPWRRRAICAAFLTFITVIVLTPLAVWHSSYNSKPGHCACQINLAKKGCAE